MNSPGPKSLRFSSLLLFSATMSLIVQVIIVSYNTLTGYYAVETVFEFVVRVIYSGAISTVLGLLLIVPDLALVNLLNRRMPWDKTAPARVLLELPAVLFIAVIISTAGTLAANTLNRYTDDLTGVLINNVLIASVINILLTAILEGWTFAGESRRQRVKAGLLRQELASIRFELLKSQINPHFMFNSLNVLSGLIDRDTRKAQQFIDEFSGIYHYVLESIEKQLVPLAEELKFARSYMYLQQIRHGDHIRLSVDIAAEMLDSLMPPLSLQTVLENALKHNDTGASAPLEIRITAIPEREPAVNSAPAIIISNSLRPKTSAVPSTGLGQKNLVRRYAMLSSRLPDFRITGESYIVTLPVFMEEN